MEQNERTDREFAEELARLFDVVDEYPPDARSIAQWAIADRLVERYAKPKKIPQIVADLTGKAMDTLLAYRATAAAWPFRRRHYDVAYATHRSMNKLEDRWTRIYEVETMNEARILAGTHASLGGGGRAPRREAAETDSSAKERAETVQEFMADPLVAREVIRHSPTRAAMAKAQQEMEEGVRQAQREGPVGPLIKASEERLAVLDALHVFLTYRSKLREALDALRRDPPDEGAREALVDQAESVIAITQLFVSAIQSDDWDAALEKLFSGGDQ